MIVFLNHRDRLLFDVFETPNNNNDYFMIITIIGPTINRSDASPKSRRMERDGSFPLDCYDYQTDYFDYTNICPGTAQESGTQVLWEPSSQR